MKWAFWRREPTFLRAVHYFGRAHPVNFWDAADLSEAPAHLARIRADGFNTVILVVPWRGFQRTLTPSTFDELNLERLRQILRMVQAAGLLFVLRVSYPWNHDPDSLGSYDERILGLFTQQEVRTAWFDYLREIRRVARAFPAFQFAFFSWEDFPSIRELMGHRPQEQRRALAQATGYRDYLTERFTLPEISRLFGKEMVAASDIYIPLADCEAYRTYNDFVNEALGSLLAFGRSAWPGLAMQVRVDYDRIQLGSEFVWIENDVRLSDFGMRVSYFFPFMYAHCEGESLSAAEVLVNLERMLRRMTNDGLNNRHFLDQFVFHDESPQFPSWSRVREEEMGEYLLGAAQLLKRYSAGFAFWNYFDYRVNHFYNAAFLRGLHGWTVRGEVRVPPGDGPRFATLAPGGSISQRMEPDMVGYATPHYEALRFAAVARAAGSPGRVRILADGIAEGEIDIASATPGTVEVAIPPERHRGGVVEVTVENLGPGAVEMSELCLWGFVYRSRIYDEHGTPGRYREAALAMVRA